MRFSIPVPGNFNLWSTVMSHGWHALPPFVSNKDNETLSGSARLSSGKAVAFDISGPRRGALEIQVHDRLSLADRKELSTVVASSLRLEEEYSTFYREANRHSRYRWIAKRGAGRLLRAPTVFEDAVKMMCTTNCSWALTEIIVGNLCRCFGEELENGQHAFPTPEAIAASTERYIRKNIRAGYRAPYLLEFSQSIAGKKLNPESWRTSTLPSAELYEEVRSVKGIGPYAAGNILKLLGRYDYLGIDSWCRKKFFELHANGRKRSDKMIERHYEPFGQWRGLFFWLDVTQDWYGVR